MSRQLERPWFKHYDAGVPKTLEYPDIPLWQLVRDSARKYPQRPALVFLGKKFSYAQVWENVERCAAALKNLGVKPGDRVALMLPNCPQFVFAFYGALLAGAITVGINPLYKPRELEFVLHDSGVATLIILNLMYLSYLEVAANVPVKHVIVAGIEEYVSFPKNLLVKLKLKRAGRWVEVEPRDATYFFATLLQKTNTPVSPAATRSSEDLASLQYTGGTTGFPKAVMMTHRNLIANCYQLRHWTELLEEGKETLLGVLPFFHSYGLTVVLNTGMLGAATIILQPRFVARDCLRAIEKYRATFLQAVPTMYTAMNELPEIERYDLRSIKFCNSGAAPLPLEIQERFEQLTGCRVVEGYGLSESGPVTHSNTIHGLRKHGSIGVPIIDVDALIVDVNGNPVPIGEVGELIVRGPNIMKGYWNRPEETANALRDGWLYTGDLAKMDEDGYFYIVDRKKDMLIVGGFNVYPREVEEVLYEHPKVQEAVVIGAPDDYLGEAVKAFLVLREGASATEEEVIAFCQQRLVHYKTPRQVEFRSELPKSAVGKLLRRVLVAEERARSLHQKVGQQESV